MTLRILLSACLALSVAAPALAGDGVTFIVVRHAEKSNDDPRDPSLSDAGHARAQRLVVKLKDTPLAAAYATAYRRTQQTVQPAAEAHDVPVMIYDAAQPADAFAAQLVAAHASGTALVAGHSNTVPQIVAALCGCEAAAMPDDEFDRISTIHIAADGQRSLQVSGDTVDTGAP